MKKLFNIIAVVAIIALLLISYSAYHKLCNVTTEHSSAVQRADSIQLLRDAEKIERDSIDIEYAELVRKLVYKSDSLNIYIRDIAIVTAENDSIRKAIALIPPDSVYKLAQIAAPDTMPKIYPFSARQTIFYYSEYIDNIGNRKLLKSHAAALGSCLDYSAGLGKQIELLNVRNSNTEKQLALADLQTELFKKSSADLNNKFSIAQKKQKYFTIGMGVAFALGVIAAK